MGTRRDDRALTRFEEEERSSEGRDLLDGALEAGMLGKLDEVMMIKVRVLAGGKPLGNHRNLVSEPILATSDAKWSLLVRQGGFSLADSDA